MIGRHSRLPSNRWFLSYSQKQFWREIQIRGLRELNELYLVDEEVVQKLHEEERRQHCDFNLDSEGHLLWLLASLLLILHNVSFCEFSLRFCVNC